MNFEYKIFLDGMDKLYLEKESLKNNAGNTIVEIDSVGSKVQVYVNAVNRIRTNNVKPIGIVDAIKLELLPCVGGATPSDVIHLMDMALDKTEVFRKREQA